MENIGKQVFHDRRWRPMVNFPRAVKLVAVNKGRCGLKADLAEPVKREQHNYSVVTKNELVKRLRTAACQPLYQRGA